jgi:hypothetical protein
MGAYLLVGQTSRLPNDVADQFILLSDGFSASEASDIDENSSIPTEKDLEFAVTVVSKAASEDDAVKNAQSAWAALGGADIRLRLLSSTPRNMIRTYRRACDDMPDGSVRFLGGAIGFKPESSTARAQAHRIIERAVLRKPWQFWR